MIDNKARAQSFWTDLFNAHDLERVDEFIAEGSVNHNAREDTPSGPAGARAVFARLWSGSSDMRFELQEMVAEDDTVICIGMMIGTHDGPFQGMPPTHKHTTARHMHLMRFNENGLITEHIAVRDDIALLRQLGAIPDTFGQ